MEVNCFGFGNGYLDVIAKFQAIKGKNELDFLKIKYVFASNMIAY